MDYGYDFQGWPTVHHALHFYNIFNTSKILNRPPRVAVTNMSGAAGIAHWINSYFNLSGGSEIDKKHPAIDKIKQWVDTEYDSGRTTLISDQELVALYTKFMAEIN